MEDGDRRGVVVVTEEGDGCPVHGDGGAEETGK